MSQSKPLTYQSLMCCVQYMDANKRIFNASRIPALRNIHKLAPLKIDLVKLDRTNLTIDNIKYSFTITVEKNPNQTVRGLDYDVDQYGESDWDFLEGSFEQEDIFIKEERPVRIAELQKSRELLQELQLFREENQQNIGALERILEENQRIEEQSENMEERRLARERAQQARNEIERRRLMLTPKPHVECNSYVQCTVTNLKNSSQKSFRFPNGSKIRDVLRQLTGNFLCGKYPPLVRRFQVNVSCDALRIPNGLKLKIRELRVRSNGSAVIKEILPFLDESSLPLHKLSVDVENPREAVFCYEILRTSESLYVNITENADMSWAQLLKLLPNSKIHLSGKIISLDDIIDLARDWIENPRNVGKKFSIQYKEVAGFMKRFKKIQSELEAVDALIPRRSGYVHGLTVPVNLTSEINIYNEMPNEQLPMLVMEVMPIGSAKPIEVTV